MKQSFISLKNLDIYDGHGKRLVKDVSIHWKPKHIIALVGETGSGKTLTATAILQLLASNLMLGGESQCMYEDEDLFSLSSAQWRYWLGKRIAYVAQDALSALNPVRTIGWQMMEMLRTDKKLKRQDRKAWVMEWLEKVDLPQKVYQQYPHELSGGMNQRALIAMMLIRKPLFLVADEPTTALDAPLQRSLCQLIQKCQRDLGMGVLFITHNMVLARMIADTVLVMQGGRVIEEGQAAEVFSKPRKPYTRLLVQHATGAIRKEAKSSKQGDKVLELHNVSWAPSARFFKKQALCISDVSADIYDGGTLALLGQSGSGKSTLARLCARLYSPTSGQVIWSKMMSQRKVPVQMISQNPQAALNPKRTLKAYFDELKPHVDNTDCWEASCRDVLAQVHLENDVLTHYPFQFSGGEKQRLCIARAILASPKLLIADEPTSALDVATQSQIMSLLQSIQKKYHIAVLLISHDFNVIAAMADYMLVLEAGRVIEQGKPDVLIKSPKTKLMQYWSDVYASSKEL